MAPSASVGSIGVYSVVMDMTAMMEKIGIKADAISSGKYKLIGADFRTMTAEERAILQAGVIELHGEFKTAVTGKRAVPAEAMEGLTYEGKSALENNLVDVVVNDASTFLQMTGNDNMKNLFRKLKPAANAAIAAASAAATEVKKLAEKEPEKKSDVPGVPGTKSDAEPEAKTEGGYDKGYVACPYCNHNIDAGFLKGAMEAQDDDADPDKGAEPEPKEKKADAPAKEEPEKKADEEKPEKEAAAPANIVQLKAASHTTVVMTAESRAQAKALLAGGDWKAAAGTKIKPQGNAFRDACNRNLEDMQKIVMNG
jgi:peptidase S49-like protein